MYSESHNESEERVMQLSFQNGPFSENYLMDPVTNRQNLLDGFDEFERELLRLNLIRKVRIHCIGIGEAKLRWLKAIAEVGGGKVVFFGTD